MSSGPRVPFAEAFELARTVSEALEPVCVRSKVAGSLRRRRPDVGDIEFVVEPLTDLVLPGLDRPGPPNVDIIRTAAAKLGDLQPNKNPLARQLTIENLLGRTGLRCELYLVHPPAQWGSILAIRTGPRALAPLVMKGFRRQGLRHINGHVPGHSTATEEEYFQLAGVPFVIPRLRDDLATELERTAAAGAGSMTP